MDNQRVFTRLNRGKLSKAQSEIRTQPQPQHPLKSKKKKLSPDLSDFVKSFRFSVIKNLNTRKNPMKSGILTVNDDISSFLKDKFKISNKWTQLNFDIFEYLDIEKSIFKKKEDRFSVSFLNFQCKFGNRRNITYYVSENGKKKEKNVYDLPKFHWKFIRETLCPIDPKRQRKINQNHLEIFGSSGGGGGVAGNENPIRDQIVATNSKSANAGKTRKYLFLYFF